LAIYHLDIKIISRQPRAEYVPVPKRGPKSALGRSVVAAAAYRSGEKIRDERREEEHDYTRSSRVLHSEIMAPDNAPDRFQDRATLWNEVEQSEKRKDAQLAREVQVSLPKELTLEQNRDLVREFVNEQFTSRGMVADVAIHTAGPKGDVRNVHAHIMLTTRELTPEGFGKKNREWNDRSLSHETREKWSELANQHLERAGHETRIDHRTYEAQRAEAIEKGDLKQLAEASKIPREFASPTDFGRHRRGQDSERWDQRQIAMKSPERMQKLDEIRELRKYAEARLENREPETIPPAARSIEERIHKRQQELREAEEREREERRRQREAAAEKRRQEEEQERQREERQHRALEAKRKQPQQVTIQKPEPQKTQAQRDPYGDARSDHKICAAMLRQVDQQITKERESARPQIEKRMAEERQELDRQRAALKISHKIYTKQQREIETKLNRPWNKLPGRRQELEADLAEHQHKREQIKARFDELKASRNRADPSTYQGDQALKEACAREVNKTHPELAKRREELSRIANDHLKQRREQRHERERGQEHGLEHEL
jgi:hypothetical protein